MNICIKTCYCFLWIYSLYKILATLSLAILIANWGSYARFKQSNCLISIYDTLSFQQSPANKNWYINTIALKNVYEFIRRFFLRNEINFVIQDLNLKILFRSLELAVGVKMKRFLKIRMNWTRKKKPLLAPLNCWPATFRMITYIFSNIKIIMVFIEILINSM